MQLKRLHGDLFIVARVDYVIRIRICKSRTGAHTAIFQYRVGTEWNVDVSEVRAKSVEKI